MAVPARDQVARVVHPEPETSETNPPRAIPAAEPQLRSRPVEEPATDAPASSPDAGASKPKSAIRRKVMIGVGALAALAVIYFGIHYIVVGRYLITTDDAYVRANNTVMGAKIAGHISKVAVGDNSRVGAGNVVFEIDNGDYRLAVESARAKVATQEGDHLAHRTSGDGTAKRGRAGEVATCLGGSRDQARAIGLHASAGIERQGIRVEGDL